MKLFVVMVDVNRSVSLKQLIYECRYLISGHKYSGRVHNARTRDFLECYNKHVDVTAHTVRGCAPPTRAGLHAAPTRDRS